MFKFKTTITSLRNSIGQSLVAIITLLLAAMASMQSVHAATITVINTADSGAGSLRQALADASDGDTINFSVTGTITLSSGELQVTHNVTVTGPGAATLAVNGNATFRVFEISASTNVTISGLTITNGFYINPPFANNPGGAGILNNGVLTLSNVTVSANSAPFPPPKVTSLRAAASTTTRARR